MNLSLILFVGAGGFFGAISRFLMASFVQKSVGFTFPVGTLSVNVVGSFIIGFMALYFENIVASEYKAFIITGFLGALTTFSTFSLENVNMLQDGEYTKVALNIMINVILTIMATVGAMKLFERFF